LDDNCAQFGCDKTADEEAFEESNLMHSINGRVYANLDGLDMVVDDKVRWFIAAFGTEVSMYTLHCSI
jgi:manganese oxidase